MAMTYEKMKPEERGTCADLAARAFFDYAYFSNYVADEEKRARFLRCTMNVEFKINRGIAESFTAKEDGVLAAVGMLCPPGYRKPSDPQYIFAGFWKPFLIGGIKNVAAWLDMETAAGKPCRELPEASWYLNLLTVEPSRKGRGIGSRMLRECIIPYVRSKGGHILTLFTNSEENRRFYQKNGFEEFDARAFQYKGSTLGSWSYRLNV